MYHTLPHLILWNGFTVRHRTRLRVQLVLRECMFAATVLLSATAIGLLTQKQILNGLMAGYLAMYTAQGHAALGILHTYGVYHSTTNKRPHIRALTLVIPFICYMCISPDSLGVWGNIYLGIVLALLPVTMFWDDLLLDCDTCSDAD